MSYDDRIITCDHEGCGAPASYTDEAPKKSATANDWWCDKHMREHMPLKGWERIEYGGNVKHLAAENERLRGELQRVEGERGRLRQKLALAHEGYARQLAAHRAVLAESPDTVTKLARLVYNSRYAAMDVDRWEVDTRLGHAKKLRDECIRAVQHTLRAIAAATRDGGTGK